MIPTSLILPQSLMEVKQALVSKMVCTLTNNVCKQCCFIDIVFIVIHVCSTQHNINYCTARNFGGTKFWRLANFN